MNYVALAKIEDRREVAQLIWSIKQTESNEMARKFLAHARGLKGGLPKPTAWESCNLSRGQYIAGAVCCSSGDGEYWTTKVLLDSTWLAEGESWDDYSDEELLLEYAMYRHYSHPGGRYSDAGYVQRNGRSVLLTQTGGLDI